MLWRVTVVLVLVGVCVTADSVCVVVVVVAGSVVQDDRTMAQAGITGIKRISFFIVSLMLTKDSPQVVSLDGTSNEFFKRAQSGLHVLCCLKDKLHRAFPSGRPPARRCSIGVALPATASTKFCICSSKESALSGGSSGWSISVPS